MENFELCLIRTSFVSKFYKSWLIFYRLGLCNHDVRNKIIHESFCPWKTEEAGNHWNYLKMFGNCQAGEMGDLEEGQRELFGMFEFWKKTTLLADEFEVFQTSSMGLGVRVIEQASQSSVRFRPLSLYALHGFLEVIPQTLFEELRSFGHSSLYKSYDRNTRKWIFSILFGPLSLANSESGNSIGFCGMDSQLRTLVWRLTYLHGFMLSEDSNSATLIDAFQCEYYDEELQDVITSEVKPKRLKYGAVVPLRIDQGNALARRRSFFLRIIMRYNKPEDEVNIVYEPGQEIFIDYDYV